MSAAGLFHQWQPVYAEAGIATYPIGEDKTPATKGYQKTGLRGSGELRKKFAAADAFGFLCGARNKITVFDYDDRDERGFRDAMDEMGTSKLIIRSASGNFQAYYRHGGEKRMIRPDKPRPFDILGGGNVLAAPSRTARGCYEIIQGSLYDLANLTKMKLPAFERPTVSIPEKTAPDAPAASTAMRDGDGRNHGLFKRMLRAGHQARSQEELMQIAADTNAQFAEPLGGDEVARIAASVWRYKDEGRLFAPGGEANAVIAHSEAEHLWDQPVAMMLLIRLRMAHSNRNGKPFALAREAASLIGVSVPTYRAARDVLVARHFIEIVHPGGMGKNDPPQARLL